jgi:hypothetical protein
MTTKTVEERIEEFKGTVWHARLKEFDRTTDDEEDRDHPTEMFIGWLRTTLTEAYEHGRRDADQETSNAIKDFHH